MKQYYDDDWCTIYHGDCFEILHDLEGIGAVITDPPYSSGGAFRGDRAQKTSAKYVNSDSKSGALLPEFSGDTRDQRSFLAWCALWLSAARHACLEGAVLLTFIDWRQLPTMTDAIQCGGWVWRNLSVWHKPGIRMQKGRFSSSAEYIIYATNGPAPQGRGSPQNVYACAPVKSKEKKHIAEKPEAVMSWLLQTVPEGAIVLDPFMGSGTTLRAAKDSGLKVIGIDSDEHSCEIAAARLQQGCLW